MPLPSKLARIGRYGCAADTPSPCLHLTPKRKQKKNLWSSVWRTTRGPASGIEIGDNKTTWLKRLAKSNSASLLPLRGWGQSASALVVGELVPGRWHSARRIDWAIHSPCRSAAAGPLHDSSATIRRCPGGCSFVMCLDAAGDIDPKKQRATPANPCAAHQSMSSAARSAREKPRSGSKTCATHRLRFNGCSGNDGGVLGDARGLCPLNHRAPAIHPALLVRQSPDTVASTSAPVTI